CFVNSSSVVPEDVYIDLEQKPALPLDPDDLLLDALDRLQQGTRFEGGFHLEHLVEESGLVGDADRLRLAHPRFADQPDAGVRQGGSRRFEVSIAVTQVTA